MYHKSANIQIIFGVRDDLDVDICFPNERNYIVPLKEALVDVPLSHGQRYPKRKADILDMIPEGGYWRNLPITIQREYMGKSFHADGGKTGIARRLSWDDPCLTLTCSPAQKQTERCHPSETRPLTVREYARIQCFPDDWQFVGAMTSQYKQIGNAVPVP
jgi:DNA (cytosine-5)-methyltransferase 1